MILKDSGGEDFEIAPAGVYQAVCYQVIDMGIKENKTFNNHQRKLRVAWELIGAVMKDGRPYSISSLYTASLSRKANLRRDLEAWRGRAFTEQELAGFSPKGLLGVGCQINVIHNESGGNTYANIGSIMPLPKGTEAPATQNEKIYFSWDETRDEYDKLPDWVKEKAMGIDPELHQPESDFNQAVQEAAIHLSLIHI